MRRLLVMFALAGCSERKAPREEVPPPPAPTPIPTPPPMRDIDDIDEPTRDGADDWSTAKTCTMQNVELIYLIDDSNHLLSFDPRQLPGDPFHSIGKVDCRDGRPNSMAVDRKGIAWVGFQTGRVHRVSIITAKCDRKGWEPSGGATQTFGMGYVTDGPKTETEKLFVAGGTDGPRRTLAVIDTEKKTWTKVGPIISEKFFPELTGTSEGKLFAYFPSPGRGVVQEVDRTTGKPLGPKWRLPGNPDEIDAYAFAHYGGVFYVFTTVEGVSAVHAIHRDTGKVELVKNHLPYTIVGAGVSTCAPLLEAPPTPP